MKRGMNPGSVHVRIGSVQMQMERAIEVGNLVLYANLLRRMRIYASVYMDSEQKRVFDSMAGLSEDDRTDSQVYEDLCLKEEYLLDILRDNDVFAKSQYEKGDASALDEEEE